MGSYMLKRHIAALPERVFERRHRTVAHRELDRLADLVPRQVQ